MRIRGMVLLGVLVGGAWATTARAELREDVAGAQALMVLPRLQANDATSFASVGFGVQAFVGYGVLHDVYVLARFGTWAHAGHLGNSTVAAATGSYNGDLYFNGQAYRGELGMKYKVLSGYNFAPFLEGYVGYQWTTFRSQDLRNAGGGSYGLTIPDVGRGAPSAGGGLSLEYRAWNQLLFSASCTYTNVWDSSYTGELMFGLSAAFVWTSVATGF